MRHAIISDIHGNLQALRAVLESLDGLGAGDAVCLGDVVGYGGDPAGCVSLIRERCSAAIMGNHDAAVAGAVSTEYFNSAAREAVNWTRQALDLEDAGWLGALPYELGLDGYCIVHATPDDPRRWSYLMSDDHAEELFGFFSGPLLFYGHTHYPLVFEQYGAAVACLGAETLSLRPGARYIINPGSVGQPRDGDPRAAFGIYDGSAGRFEFHRVPYDIDGARKAILDAGLPRVLADRLSRGR